MIDFQLTVTYTKKAACKPVPCYKQQMMQLLLVKITVIRFWPAHGILCHPAI